MIKNYILVAFRNIIRHRAFSIINLTGLSIGLASFLFLFLYIQHELSYDRFHDDLDKIQRVCHWQHYSDFDFACPVSPFPMAEDIKATYPEIPLATRYVSAGNRLITYGDKSFKHPIVATDADFFKIFRFPLIAGGKEKLFKTPDQIVITQTIANQFFPDGSAMGKVLKVDRTHHYQVAGIISNPPANSSLQFDLMVPVNSLNNNPFPLENWGSNWATTYVKVQKGVQPDTLSNKMVHYLDDAREDEHKTEVYLFPFKDEHFYNPDGSPASISRIRMFGLIAFFILLLACINYINLATAQAAVRAKEVGLRKVAGARRHNLIGQFLGESFLMTFLGLIFALILVHLFLPQFNLLANTHIRLQYTNGIFLLGLGAIWVLTGVMSGLYPAFVLSKQDLSKVLKGNNRGNSGQKFRIGLVVLQFTLSVTLIISVITVYLQTRFLINKDLGYQKEQLVSMGVTDQMRPHLQTIGEELRKNPQIENCTFTSHLLTAGYSNGGGWDWEGRDPSVNPLVTNMFVDHNFLSTYKIKLANGRDFSPEKNDLYREGQDYAKVIINETFAEIIGKEKANEIILHRGENHDFTYQVVGIVEDFHFYKANRKIDPLIFSLGHDEELLFLTIEVAGHNMMSTMKYIEKTMATFNPGYPFTYKFVDDQYNKLYQSERRTEGILRLFALLAIAISCLGLFGLATFTTQRRTKEIGIRKSLGASTRSVVWMLSRQFSVWVLIANIIAWPLAYYAMVHFLSNFAYRIQLQLWIFLLSGMLTWLLALLTIFQQTYLAASRNPATSLRYE
ncbi:MAG: ABC transporter permease [Bacteroidota bacterium]